MSNKAYLNRLFESDKPLIIYKATEGFDVYTDFSDKAKIQKSNLKNFLKKTTILEKKRNKFFDGYIGFFSYEFCCELIGVKIPKQHSNNFFKRIHSSKFCSIINPDQLFLIKLSELNS